MEIEAVTRRTIHLLLLSLALLRAASAESLPLKIYTAADGLPYDSVKRIVQDSRGFVWLCTPLGLSRFDGRQFVNYEVGAHSANDMLEAGDGTYWVATNGSGVYRFDPSAVAGRRTGGDAQPHTNTNAPAPRFTHYAVGDGPATNRVNAIFRDRAGRVWAGTDAGLFRLEGTEGAEKFSRIELGVPSQPDGFVQVWAFAEDEEENVWIGTGVGLTRLRPDGSMTHYEVNPALTRDAVLALLIDREGRLWLGHQRGLFVFKPRPAPGAGAGERFPWARIVRRGADQTSRRGGATESLPAAPGEARHFTTGDGLGRDDVRALVQDSDGRIWAATSGGLTVFDGTRSRSYTTAQGLSSDVVTALSRTRDGNLWIGTQASGAMRLAARGFVTYRKADGLGHDHVYAISEQPTGELLAVSGEWRINRLDDGKFTSVRPNLPAQIRDADWRAFYHILADQAGEWWVATGQGLYRFPRVRRIEELAGARPEAVYTASDGMASDGATYLFEDSRGDLWFSSFAPRREVVTRWERATDSFHRYSDADGLPPSNPAQAFCEDRAGNLWVGFREGGLARRRAGRFALFGVSEGVPGGPVSQVYVDRRGRLWAAIGGGGLLRADDPDAERVSFVRYTTAEGLSGDRTFFITEDEGGNIYVGTSRGIDRLDPTTNRVRHFTLADGLPSAGLGVAFRDRRGSLWFGTAKGLSRFDPRPDEPRRPPQIFIGDVRVNGESRPVSDLGETEVKGLRLEPHQNQIQIDFFGLGEDLRYQFKLEGDGRDWGAPTEQRTIIYPDMAPGTYRFMVRAVGADSTFSPAPAAVSFTILPPVWRRAWFIALVALAILLLAYALYRYRVRRLVEIERVRTRIATDLHDDIGASLSRMAILSEVVKHRTTATHSGDGGGDEQSADMLTEIADSARGLVDSMSDIVWSIDPRKDDLRSVVLRVRQFASDVLEAKGIEWSFHVPPELERVKLDPDTRRHLFLIFKEGVNNVARHADCKTVSLSLAVDGHHLVGEIKDDGRGFVKRAPEQNQANGRGGHGLPNMGARSAEVGGRLDVISTPGAGTRLTLKIPLR